jgi:hypothetical protein
MMMMVMMMMRSWMEALRDVLDQPVQEPSLQDGTKEWG